MKKRKQSGSSDLRTSPLTLQLHRYSNLPLLRVGSSRHWNVQHLQPFFPPIECLFKSEHLETPHEYGIKLKDEVQSILADDKIRTATGTEIAVHLKKTMLLSPFKWMQGDYGTTVGLPTISEQSVEIQSKLQNPNNAAYVGSLSSIAFSESGCPHFPKVYGVFTGVSQSHTIDISDDYPELCERSWFSQNIGKTFELKLSESVTQSEFQHTRTARSALQLGDEITLDDVEELQTDHVESLMGDLKNVFEDEISAEDDDDQSSVSTSYIFGIHSCDCNDLEGDDEDDDESGDAFAWATFANVPIHITVMEKCNGLFYDLMMCESDQDKRLAWMTQVMFALAYAQRNFGFVHNDLHSNNIMYVPTEKEYLYYNLAGTLYKVPTHGHLIKLIDFERGICSVKLTGMKDAKFFMSDHFSSMDEAGGQYNYPPFYNSKYAEVKPNPSFDLVRLATSLFWDLFPEGPSHEDYKQNPLFLFFTKWLTAEDGSSVLFGKEDPRHDRYHGFTLYKAITRYCKDNAVPRKELVNVKMFYEVPAIPMGEIAIVIDV